MKNLEELLTDAANAAEASNETFNRLHNLLTGEILPSYAVAMAALGHSQVFFNLPVAPFYTSFEHEDAEHRITYPVVVDFDNSTIGNAHIDGYTGKYYAADDFYQRRFDEVSIINNAQCVLIRTLISTLDKAIVASSASTADAMSLLALFE